MLSTQERFNHMLFTSGSHHLNTDLHKNLTYQVPQAI